jgi:hypothetical protein
MKYLIFTLLTSLTIALFTSACVAGQTAKAPPLVVSLPKSTPLPHDPPAEPQAIIRPRLIPPGLRVEGPIPDSVTERFYRLAYLYPDVAKRTQRIVARRAGGKGWAVSYEAKTIYINVDKGEYVLTDKLTEQFARRAYDHLKRYQPITARTFRTWQRFAGVLARVVR